MALLYWPTSYKADFVYLMCKSSGFRERAAQLPSSYSSGQLSCKEDFLTISFWWEGKVHFATFFLLSDKHFLVDRKPRCLRWMNNELSHIQDVHYKCTRFVWGLKQGSFYDLLVTQLYSCYPHGNQCFKKILNSLTHQGTTALNKTFSHTHTKVVPCSSTFSQSG